MRRKKREIKITLLKDRFVVKVNNLNFMEVVALLEMAKIHHLRRKSEQVEAR